MWTDITTLPPDGAEVNIVLKDPHHGKTVLASRFCADYTLPLAGVFGGPKHIGPCFFWGGGVISLGSVLCWCLVPPDPRSPK